MKNPSTAFSTFDVNQLGKIRQHHWKKRFKIKLPNLKVMRR